MSTPLTTEVVGSAGRTERGAGMSLLVRSAALAAVCGAALLALRVGVATDSLTENPVGELVARFDAAVIVLLVGGAAVIARPTVDRLLAGRPPVPWRRHYACWLVPLYGLWIPVVVLDQVVVDPGRGVRALVLTMVFFRDAGDRPIAGLGIGPVLTMLAMTVALLPVADRVLRRDRNPRLATVLRLAGLLAAVGIVVRTALVLTGRTAPFGPLSWLPAHLDALGAGLAVAALHVAGRLTGRRRVAASMAATASMALIVGAIALPPTPILTDGRDVWVRGLLAVIAATGTVVAVASTAGPTGRAVWAMAVVAPGLVLAGDIVFIAIARQYREMVSTGPFGLRLTGPALPLWLWSVLIAAAIGVLLTASVLVPLRRRVVGAWPQRPYPLALAAVVSGGLLIRVVTWLAIAPERTDGGDPLFYHVTANVVAAGRGFPEPLNWLDSGTHLASALHGPLYPLVLSIGSRLGGTTYVDHKFVSILVGTATVLLTALVAERLGGRRAAVAAGALAAIYPNLWLIDSLLFPEGLFAMLTTACVLVAYQWRDRPAWWRAGLLGVLIGLAALTRGEGLLLGPLLAAPWMLCTRALDRRARWRHLVLAGAGCVVVLAPWTIRNLTTFDVFVPLSTNGNELIMYANCDDTYSGRQIGFWSFACQERHRDEFGDPEGDEAQKAAYWRDVGADYAREHLGELPKVVAVRVLRQWELFRPWQTVDFSTIENRDRDATTIGLGMYYVLVAGAIVGAVTLHRRGVPLWPLGAQVVSVTITAAYAYGTVRFRAPVEPVLCILAGVTAANLLVRAITPTASSATEVTVRGRPRHR